MTLLCQQFYWDSGKGGDGDGDNGSVNDENKLKK